jgi:hypothetical protein
MLDSTLGRIATLLFFVDEFFGSWNNFTYHESLNNYLSFQLSLNQLYRASVVEDDSAFISFFKDELVMLVLCDLKLPMLVAPDGNRGWMFSRFAHQIEGADEIDFMEASFELLSLPVFNIPMPFAAVVQARLDAIAQQRAHFDFPWEP